MTRINAWEEDGHRGKAQRKPGSRPDEDSIPDTRCETKGCGEHGYWNLPYHLFGPDPLADRSTRRWFCSIACVSRYSTRLDVSQL